MIKQKHQQLFDLLSAELRGGKWPKGAKLPNQKELAQLYSVSVNVVSQAVELLKNSDLVKARKGDGIYSNYTVPTLKSEQKYAGERLYGRYSGAKKLTVLVEDGLDWQIDFWNRFFQRFSSENPDIELDVYFDHLNSAEHPARFDVAIGGGEFLAKSGMMDHRLSRAIASEFYPELYRETLLTPDDFADGLFPIGCVESAMLARPDALPPRAGENLPDYIERTIAPGGSGVLIRQGLRLLQSSGVDLLNRPRQGLTAAEKEKLTAFFGRCIRLYRDGRLLWTLGRVDDGGQIETLLKNGGLTAVEKQWGSRDVAQMKTLPYPHGEKEMIVPILCVIDDRTCFPEEPLRLLKSLLAEKHQKAADQSNISRPISTRVLDPSSLLAECFRQGAVEFRRDYSLTDLGVYYCVFCWELLYILQGRRGADAVEMLDKKLRYYYEMAEKYPERIVL